MVACDEATAGIFRVQPNGALQLDAPAVAAVKAAAAKAAAIAAAEAARAQSDVPVADINSAEHADAVGAATAAADTDDVEVGPDGQGKEAAAAAAALAAAAAAEAAALDAEATAEHTAATADSGPKLCLTVDATSVTNVAQLSGALVTLAVCADSNSNSNSSDSKREQQVWELDDKAAGTVTNAASGFCMTGGWPFLSSAAFVRPDGQLAVVVLNEAQEAVEFDIALEHAGTELAASIPAHSIQTYII
jgi:hypothetical protein